MRLQGKEKSSSAFPFHFPVKYVTIFISDRKRRVCAYVFMCIGVCVHRLQNLPGYSNAYSYTYSICTHVWKHITLYTFTAMCEQYKLPFPLWVPQLVGVEMSAGFLIWKYWATFICSRIIVTAAEAALSTKKWLSSNKNLYSSSILTIASLYKLQGPFQK